MHDEPWRPRSDNHEDFFYNGNIKCDVKFIREIEWCESQVKWPGFVEGEDEVKKCVY